MNPLWRKLIPSLLTRLSFTLLLIFLFAGCGKKTADLNQSKVTGYLCLKCSQKFYTEEVVVAEHCPACKDVNIHYVTAYVCERDKALTLAPAGRMGKCEKCGDGTTTFRPPQEAELIAWGAIKKSKAEVSN